MSREILSPRCISDLREGLKKSEPVRYRENGNRATDGAQLLQRLEVVAEQVGITRVADISDLSPLGYPVFQATRPNLLHHPAMGNNTGSQGKGATKLQAKISCLMEGVEAYCAEPRNVDFVRGTHRFLRGHQVTLDPQAMQGPYSHRKAEPDEPLLWAPAYEVRHDTEILVPAQSVYCFLPLRSYRTRGVFPASSNGLASGATYLEASIHALYELIERMYIAHGEKGAASIECLYEEEFPGFDFDAYEQALGAELELQLFAVRLPGIPNIPMIACVLVGDHQVFTGWGCAGDVDTSIMRAISEAMQSYTVLVSSARDDLRHHASLPSRERPPPKRNPIKSFLHHLPEYRTLHIEQLRAEVLDRTYDDLRDEFDALIAWLSDRGYPVVCISNLTRIGIDIPVVKAVVPGLPTKWVLERQVGGGWDDLAIIARRYSLGPP